MSFQFLGHRVSEAISEVQLRHVGHGSLIGVNDAVLTRLRVSGRLSPILQEGVDQSHRDGHHGEQDEQSQHSQSPVGVRQITVWGLEVWILINHWKNWTTRCSYCAFFCLYSATCWNMSTFLCSSYRFLVPRRVCGPFDDGADGGDPQQSHHGQQANIFPQIFVDDCRAPA